MSEIEWEKITQKPDKKYPVVGEFLLEQKKLIELQEQQITKHLATMDQFNAELKSAKDELEARTNKIKEMVEKIGEMNEKFEEINKKVEETKNESQELKNQIEKLTEEISSLKENNSLQEDLVKQKDEEIQNLSEQNEQQKNKITELETKLESFPNEDEINEMRDKIQCFPSPEELDELKKRPPPDEIDQLLFNKDEEIEKINEEVKDLKAEIEELKEKVEAPATVEAAVPVASAKPIPAPTPKKSTAKAAAQATPMVDLQSPKFSITDDSKFVKQKSATFSLAGSDSSEEVTAKKRELPEEVINILNNISMAIQGGIKAGELCRLLEESRDTIANIFGFSQALKQMGDVAKKLKRAPENAQIDDASVKIFLQKIEEWKNTLAGG